MNFFVGLEDDHQVIIYPLLVRAGKKVLVFLIFGSLLFALYGLFAIVTGHNPTLGWQVFLSFGLCFCIFILQFSWGSVLTLDEQMLSLRPNPFLKRIDLRWEEIASIRVSGKHRLFLDITLVAPSIEAFLQRQSPLMRNILAKRIEQTGRIVRFSQRLLPGDVPLSLLHLIQRRYQQQVEQYHIILLDERG